MRAMFRLFAAINLLLLVRGYYDDWETKQRSVCIDIPVVSESAAGNRSVGTTKAYTYREDGMTWTYIPWSSVAKAAIQGGQ